MYRKIGISLGFAVVLVLTAAACSSLLPAPPAVLATSTPELAVTTLTGNLTAIPTSTATPPPASRTPTATRTRYPTITPIPSSTPIPSFTPQGAGPTLTPTATPEGTPSADYACEFISKSPENWTVFKPRASFDGVWKVKNTGIKPWRVGQVVLTYVSGAKLYAGERTYPLTADIKPGSDPVILIADMVTPKAKGDFSSFWGLMETRTSTVFCQFSIRITVK